MRLWTLALGLTVLVGCLESGITETHTFEISDMHAGRYSEEAPGLLVFRSDLGSKVTLALCGQTFDLPYEDRYSNLGCMNRDLKKVELTFDAWIEPAPQTFDHAALCDADPLLLDDSITGGEPFTVATQAAEDWPQFSTTSMWRRDATPCGGSLSVDYNL